MQGILLMNLGSPDSPSVPDVRRYLREFLMDPRVIDAPYPVRFGVVHFSILPKRPHQSAEAYRSIWTDQGSPLIVTTRKLKEALQDCTGMPVEMAMRYQRPTPEEALDKLALRGVTQVILVPLFPHYAMSSYETAVERVRTAVRDRRDAMTLQVLPPFYDHPAYVRALVDSAEPYLTHEIDHLLFSFHGLPERHLRKADPTSKHCLTFPNCCETPSPAHRTCYRAQCFATVKAFAEATDLPRERYSIAFQSRLGKEPWMQPYTDAELERLAKAGVKKLAVICPAFVADCLETIEEIGMRGREIFLNAGGEEFTLIPCLNDRGIWVEALAEMLTPYVRHARPVRECRPAALAAA
jgi:protoporphyrin/coproporphyrin ferrochelatase